MPCFFENTAYGNSKQFAETIAPRFQGKILETLCNQAYINNPDIHSQWKTFVQVPAGNRKIIDYVHINESSKEYIIEDLHATRKANTNGAFGPTTKKHEQKTFSYDLSPFIQSLRDKGYRLRSIGDSNPLPEKLN